jgi:hypothetical protein
MKYQAPHRRKSLDLFDERFKVNLALFKLSYKPDQISQISPQPIQPPNNERVAFTKALEASVEPVFLPLACSS